MAAIYDGDGNRVFQAERRETLVPVNSPKTNDPFNYSGGRNIACRGFAWLQRYRHSFGNRNRSDIYSK